MIGSIPVDKSGKPTIPQSSYNPTQAVKDLTVRVGNDYNIGYGINHRPFREFNDFSLIDRMDLDQKAFNGYVEPQSDDPEQDWRWNGVTDITRNKILSTTAHLVSGLMYPGTFAQNDEDEEDRMASYIMGDLVEWNITHSDYEITFLYAVIAALVNPVAYIQVDYSEMMQTIKERTAEGSYNSVNVPDETLSGMHFYNVPADEILIANPSEYYLQKQRFIIHRRYIDYDEAKAKYGEHENFPYVSPGIQITFNANDGTFYEQVDQNVPTLCEEVIYYNRREDIEIPFVNGVYFGDAEVNANPMSHRDNKNRPKYPYVKLIAEPVERFYFGKSYAAKLANRQELADQVWRTVVDAMNQEVMPPLAVIGGGDEGIDANIAYPGSQHHFAENTKIEAIGTGRNVVLASNVLQMIKDQMSESTQSEQLGGNYEPGERTKYEVARIEANARINLGILGRMIVQGVRDIGELLVDNIIRYQTIGHIEEVIGGEIKMKYRSFISGGKSIGKKSVTQKIIFDGGMIGKKLTKKQELEESFARQKEQGGMEGEAEKFIIRANPQLFSRLKFLITIEAESWMPRNKRFEELLQLEKYDRLIVSPYTDHEQVTQDFLLKPLVKGDVDKYMAKDKQDILNQIMGQKMTGSPIGEMARAVQKPEVEAALAQ